MNFFNKNLRYLRLKKGWKQEELALKLGLKANSISNYEHNKSSPDYDILDKIIKTFDVEANDILFVDMEKTAEEVPLMREDQPGYGIKITGKELEDLKATIKNLNAYIIMLQQKSTEHAAAENLSDVHAKLDVLQEAIAEVGSGKKWLSKEEGVATLGKLYFEKAGKL